MALFFNGNPYNAYDLSLLNDMQNYQQSLQNGGNAMYNQGAVTASTGTRNLLNKGIIDEDEANQLLANNSAYQSALNQTQEQKNQTALQGVTSTLDWEKTHPGFNSDTGHDGFLWDALDLVGAAVLATAGYAVATTGAAAGAAGSGAAGGTSALSGAGVAGGVGEGAAIGAGAGAAEGGLAGLGGLAGAGAAEGIPQVIITGTAGGAGAAGAGTVAAGLAGLGGAGLATGAIGGTSDIPSVEIKGTKPADPGIGNTGLAGLTPLGELVPDSLAYDNGVNDLPDKNIDPFYLPTGTGTTGTPTPGTGTGGGTGGGTGTTVTPANPGGGTGGNPGTSIPLGPILGGLNDYFNNKYDKNYYKGLIDKLNGMYAYGTPEEQYLRQKIEAQDAATGRRSQYGVRETNLAGILAGQRANIMTNPVYAGYVNAYTGKRDDNLNSLLSLLGNQSGGNTSVGGINLGQIGSAINGANSIYNGLGSLWNGAKNVVSNVGTGLGNLANSIFG